MMTTVAPYFDTIDYHAGSATNLELLTRMHAAGSLWARGDVLDVGSGGLIYVGLDNVRWLTLVDIAAGPLADPKMLCDGQLVPLDFLRTTTKQADALFLPFEDASFDVVILNYVCHHLALLDVHLSRERTLVALREARRVLRRDGVVLVSETLTTWLSRPVQRVLFGPACRVAARWGKPLPYFYSRSRLVRLMHDAGLAVISITPISWGRRVYSPLFPSLAVPGWLWRLGLGVEMFVGRRA